MKSTGIVRKVDGLGRMVIPKELRNILDIQIKDPIEIFVDGEKIVLQKYVPATACLITGEVRPDNITLADGKITLSKEMAEEIVEQLKTK
ncbi:AbrB/MazE/SpoVT family DNA-binding domain-containing protein [Gracilibacillus alcaliphilus]|uniref:AbrB/MazE/SpoVT family DNA-binding domain-containing protein n=1 Tax=Gracilibacillus alcaliphilus TaxID=1401441 RepID=UPI00195687FF|nr:AbrB/MazE/SpoVT family DNA-binding domain-containing protein [Gracilibacillus alcaliphilus]MBM7677416.1 transcriptional pleiotropic regulator of transition state genes [Gracilibacillus alcaliphilus]